MSLINKITYYFNKWFDICDHKEFNKISNRQVWYGRVNDWKDLKTSEKDILRCKDKGVSGYLIEMAGEINPVPGQWSDAWVDEIEKKYKKLLRMTRAAGIWLFVSIVNDNMGKGKYGDTSPTLAKVMDKAKRLAAIVKANGTTGVYVQPVAETQTDGGRIFEKHCKIELTNFQLVYNGNVGFPKGTGGYQYRAVHPATTTTACPADSFVVSDHSKIIRELAQGGKMDGTVKEDKADTWMNTVFVKSNCKVLGYYAFQRKKHDKETISILGKLMKKYK